MTALLRNCAHGSTIQITAEYDEQGECVQLMKASAHADGIENLRKELAGFTWYQKRQDFNLQMQPLVETDAYLKISMPWIKAEKYNFNHGLLRLKGPVERVIDHYCQVWAGLGDTGGPVHGDLSIDNVLFTQDQVIVIDWEHFHEGPFPVGYDAVYFLFECLWFEVREQSFPSTESIEFSKGCLKKLQASACLSQGFKQKPLSAILSFIQENCERVWGKQLIEQPTKLPIVCWEPNTVARFDALLSLEA